jgi:hypothetical protein
MLGDTQTILAGGPGGATNTLKKINQDSYGSEYLARGSVGEVRMKVRHSTESNASVMSVPFERHNVELTRVYYADGSTYLEDTYIVMSFTLRTPKTLAAGTTADWVHGLLHWIGNAALTGTADDDRIADLVYWES